MKGADHLLVLEARRNHVPIHSERILTPLPHFGRVPSFNVAAESAAYFQAVVGLAVACPIIKAVTLTSHGANQSSIQRNHDACDAQCRPFRNGMLRHTEWPVGHGGWQPL